MASAPVLLSIEEYLSTSYHPDADFVDGELEQRNLGEFDHSRIQWLLSVYFGTREKQWHVQGVTEQRIRVNSSRVRICDLALLHDDAPHEKVTVTPPFLCIEIMSPEDRIPRAKLVLRDYQLMGVENIWLINPVTREAWTFDADGLHDADPTHLFVPGTPIELDLTEIFAALG